jgi:hypothetical protein
MSVLSFGFLIKIVVSIHRGVTSGFKGRAGKMDKKKQPEGCFPGVPAFFAQDNYAW